ncbi:MAG: hypothetical protein K9H84_03730 [Bacteroidales bacterium]|nr:hypothetical protein [Bacteroidales bacterium]
MCDIIAGKILTASESESQFISKAFASDLMSDVLMLDSGHILLITGLSNPQVIRTAEMSDIKTVVVGRNKKCSSEMINLAKECDITLIESPYSIFKISGVLYESGINPIF